ncbi:MAG: hypothetical protein KME11_04725 [Timaviella obliquedivisa GSE-PSE-MK23-08B]|jgi:hypothetical protein|nr:hypothetical protein [Timaviella obliquedivisa GSE-PSE-MK23-08B]
MFPSRNVTNEFKQSLLVNRYGDRLSHVVNLRLRSKFKQIILHHFLLRVARCLDGVGSIGVSDVATAA